MIYIAVAMMYCGLLAAATFLIYTNHPYYAALFILMMFCNKLKEKENA